MKSLSSQIAVRAAVGGGYNVILSVRINILILCDRNNLVC